MKKKQKDKPSLAAAYRNAKGFGSLPEDQKKKIKVSRFRQALGKDK